jgi:hypothetical protein
MNCTPADYRLQKSVGQTTNRNRARLPSLFGMKFTQVPGKNMATDLQNKPCHPTLFGIHWHPFGVLEADDYRQNNHLRFGNNLIFVNYIYMNKKEFK